MTTTTNFAYFNRECNRINEYVHTELLGNNTLGFEIGDKVVCRKYLKLTKGVTLNTNYDYTVKSFQPTKKTVCLHDEIDDKFYTIPEKYLNENFVFPYCMTIDSSQGTTISADIKYTIFDCGLQFACSLEHLWVALTRTRKLSNVTVMTYSKAEIAQRSQIKLMMYFRNKCSGYKSQDKKANRQYDDELFVDDKWIFDKYKKNPTCEHCMKQFEIEFSTGLEINSDLTVDRINNKLAHLKTNCVLSCLHCNVIFANRKK